MSYFEVLVGMGVIFEAFVSFLPVGHTHEDIDQVFQSNSRAFAIARCGYNRRPFL